MADLEGVQGVRLNPPPRPHVFKYPMKMIYFGLTEILKKTEIKSAKRTPTHLYILNPSPETLDPSLLCIHEANDNLFFLVMQHQNGESYSRVFVLFDHTIKCKPTFLGDITPNYVQFSP